MAKSVTASQKDRTLDLVRLVCRALEDKKAGDLRVLYVGPQSSITDYLVLATVTSDPHLRALRVELEKVLDAQQAKIMGIDTGQGSGWGVVDAFQIMVHLFTEEQRAHYGLENLWKDAEDIPVSSLLAPPKPRAKRPAVAAAARKKKAAAPRKPRAASEVKPKAKTPSKPKAATPRVKKKPTA